MLPNEIRQNYSQGRLSVIAPFNPQYCTDTTLVQGNEFFTTLRRGESMAKNKHHRKPRSIGGTNDPSNISIVDVKDHIAYHQLFKNMDIHDIVKVLNDTWCDADFRIVAIPKKTARKILRTLAQL